MMKESQMGVCACIMVLVVFSGCAALGTRVIHSEPFAGVKTDYAMCFHRDGISPECRINPLLAVVDAPFSLVVDLCFLPVEIGHHSGHCLWNPPPITENQETNKTNIPNPAAKATAPKVAEPGG